MRTTKVPAPLRDRLGHDATVGLLELVDSEHDAWSERVLSVSVERFERRLAEELGQLRVALVREIHETRSETIKWAFLFWVSQVTAFAGLLVFIFKNGIR
jgi:hypothetical protein